VDLLESIAQSLTTAHSNQALNNAQQRSPTPINIDLQSEFAAGLRDHKNPYSSKLKPRSEQSG
jgi:hypothetical protein